MGVRYGEERRRLRRKIFFLIFTSRNAYFGAFSGPSDEHIIVDGASNLNFRHTAPPMFLTLRLTWTKSSNFSTIYSWWAYLSCRPEAAAPCAPWLIPVFENTYFTFFFRFQKHDFYVFLK